MTAPILHTTCRHCGREKTRPNTWAFCCKRCEQERVAAIRRARNLGACFGCGLPLTERGTGQRRHYHNDICRRLIVRTSEPDMDPAQVNEFLDRMVKREVAPPWERHPVPTT